MQPDIFMDGYIPCTFGAEKADRHFHNLLKFLTLGPDDVRYNDTQSHFSASVDGGSWILDHRVDPQGGSIVPQDLWQPGSERNYIRHVSNATLCMPIFFISQNESIGVPLVDVLERD